MLQTKHTALTSMTVPSQNEHILHTSTTILSRNIHTYYILVRRNPVKN